MKTLTKHSMTYRLTVEALALLTSLAQKSGISRTAMLELLIRKEAKREGVKAHD